LCEREHARDEIVIGAGCRRGWIVRSVPPASTSLFTVWVSHGKAEVTQKIIAPKNCLLFILFSCRRYMFELATTTSLQVYFLALIPLICSFLHTLLYATISPIVDFKFKLSHQHAG
jgi:hypothetical protein